MPALVALIAHHYRGQQQATAIGTLGSARAGAGVAAFVIGGLLKNNLVNNFNGLPALGEVPILGALFRSVDYQQDKTELVFVVTARLVQPQVGPVPLPTDAVPVPSRADVLFGAKFGNQEPAAEPVSVPPPATAAANTSPSGFELR